MAWRRAPRARDCNQIAPRIEPVAVPPKPRVLDGRVTDDEVKELVRLGSLLGRIRAAGATGGAAARDAVAEASERAGQHRRKLRVVGLDRAVCSTTRSERAEDHQIEAWSGLRVQSRQRPSHASSHVTCGEMSSHAARLLAMHDVHAQVHSSVVTRDTWFNTRVAGWRTLERGHV